MAKTAANSCLRMPRVRVESIGSPKGGLVGLAPTRSQPTRLKQGAFSERARQVWRRFNSVICSLKPHAETSVSLISRLGIATMYTITKRFAFSASHIIGGLLPDHPCGRLHGHNYEVRGEPAIANARYLRIRARLSRTFGVARLYQRKRPQASQRRVRS